MTTSLLAREDQLLQEPPLPGPSVSPLSDADLGPVVRADDPCEAENSGAGPRVPNKYLHARYYDPQLGIFLSPDPMGVLGGLNAYGYAFGDPVNLADRSGYGPDGVPGLPWWLPDWAIWKILEGLFGGGDAAGCPGGAANCRPRPGGVPTGDVAVPRPEPCSIVTTPCDGIGGGVGGEPETPPLVIGPVVIIGPEEGTPTEGPNPRNPDRVSCVMAGGGCDFVLDPTPTTTWYPLKVWEFMTRPLSKVRTYEAEIADAAAVTGLEIDLLRAVMHYESGIGGPKDLIAGPLGRDQTIQPMNVGRQWAGRFGLTVTRLRDPRTNIRVGARILQGIRGNLRPDANVAEIYTLYNDLYATRVHWRGVVVEEIYVRRLWE